MESFYQVECYVLKHVVFFFLSDIVLYHIISTEKENWRPQEYRRETITKGEDVGLQDFQIRDKDWPYGTQLFSS